MTPERLDVLAVGRVTVVPCPQRVGEPPRGVVTFAKLVGGRTDGAAVVGRTDCSTSGSRWRW
jgi:hypothetical protein